MHCCIADYYFCNFSKKESSRLQILICQIRPSLYVLIHFSKRLQLGLFVYVLLNSYPEMYTDGSVSLVSTHMLIQSYYAYWSVEFLSLKGGGMGWWLENEFLKKIQVQF